jgi:DNA-binding response OmpR family regulator
MPERHTVLFVDDEREILIAATLRLGAAGYNILTACDGVDGMALAAERRPDVILLDVRMPRMDGLTALRELKRRSDTEDIPVIMLSASIIDRQEALDAGARTFLKKPYSGDMLVRTVNLALGSKRPAIRVLTSE